MSYLSLGLEFQCGQQNINNTKKKAYCSTQNAGDLHMMLKSLSTMQVVVLITNLPWGKQIMPSENNNQEMCLLE